VNDGGLSTGVVVVTVTVKVAVPVLNPSLAEQVTVVVPTGKFEPDEGEQFGMIEPATASVAEAAPYVTAVPEGLPVVTLSFAGGVTTGGVVSTTVTLNDEAAELPASVQFTVVGPSGNVVPDAGVQV
jgi:hypothetical protein